MQSQMELFAAELRIPEVRSSSTRGLVSATRVGISGEIHVIMACRDIPTEGVLEQERSRVVTHSVTIGQEGREQRRQRVSDIRGQSIMATYTLEAQDKDGILKEAFWLDE